MHSRRLRCVIERVEGTGLLPWGRAWRAGVATAGNRLGDDADDALQEEGESGL